jgi:hypothetical protein
MRPLAYIVSFVRVLLGLGLYGWLVFASTVFVGVGWAEDYFPVRRALNPTFKAWVGVDMPPSLPWLFIAGGFVLIALIRLVHRHVMWEATLPHIEFSEPRALGSPLEIEFELEDGSKEILKERIVLGAIEVSNAPRTKVGAREAGDAWVTAIFVNDVTKEKREVRYCRWEGNPKPRKDTFLTEKVPRYRTEWNVRTLPPNSMPHRIDFCVLREDGELYGFSGYSQEKYGWADPALKLWSGVAISVTLIVRAANLEPDAKHKFKLFAGQRLRFS